MLSDRRIQTRINETDDHGLTALHYAARDKHFELAKLLIEKGKAYAAAKDEDGASPLHYCARKRHRQNTETTGDLIHLLAYLTDVNVRDRYLSTPLHFAAMRGNDVAAQALLDCKGVEVNAKDSLGYTPLHEAAVYNDLQVAILLIKFGADIGALDKTGRTSLHFAVKGEDNVNMMKLLLQNMPNDKVKEDIAHDEVTEVRMLLVHAIPHDDVIELVNKKDNDNNTALHLAIDARNTPAVKLLLKKGALVNMPCRTSSSGSTPLHLAAITGDTQVIGLLLSCKAKLYSRDLGGSTPLHKAVEYQNVPAVEWMLREMHSAPEQKDKESYTPLLVAVCYSDVDIVEALLSAGSDVRAEDRQDRNAFHLAAANNAQDILKVLVKYAKQQNCLSLLNTEDRKGETPLHIASRMAHNGFAQLLIDSGADLSMKNEDEETAFLLAAKTGNTELVELFIQTSEKVLNDQDEFSNSALHLAAFGGHVAVVETLIRCGADKDMRNVRLDTPMDNACFSGHVDVVRFLLDEEVSPNDEDDKKETPLLLAARNGHETVVSCLIESGADVTAVDKRGRNCLSLAVDKGCHDVAKAIIQSSRWKSALLQELNHHGRIRDTPMRKLIRCMPDVAQLVLNRLITSSPDEVHPSDPNYWYHFNFMFLDDTYFDYESIPKKRVSALDEFEYDKSQKFDCSQCYANDKAYLLENHPLIVMVDKNRDELLSHPLCIALIRNKWNACRPAYFGYMVFYAIFLAVLSAFMVIATPPYMPGGECNTTAPDISVQTTFERGGKYFIIIYAVLGIISEIVQIVTQQGLYIMQPFNLLDWFTYISSILVVTDITSCQARTPWQWQLGAFSVFTTWINFLLLLRRLPVIGIYAIMIQDILKTFFKFFIVFLLFLLAFSCTFFILLRNQTTFQGFGPSIVKTWTMMLGEFTYNEVFYPEDEPIPYNDVTYALLIVFLVVMAIVVVNLMTGLAIDDVSELQRHARLRKLAIQMELAISMELCMPWKLRRFLNFTVSGITLFPNNGDNTVTRFLKLLIDGSILNNAKIIKTVAELESGEQTEMAHLEQKLDRYMSSGKGEMYKLNSRLDRLESLMETLVSAQNAGKRQKRTVLPSLLSDSSI